MAKGTIKDITNDKVLEAAGYSFVKKYPKLGQSNPYGSFKNASGHEIQKEFNSKLKPDMQILFQVQFSKGFRMCSTAKDALAFAAKNESLIEAAIRYLDS